MAQTNISAKTQYKVNKCDLFYCGKIRNWRCCAYCTRKENCDNVCLNRPEKCGAFVAQDRNNDEKKDK